jgi:hypothetical protein
MSDEGAVATINDICDGIKRYLENNDESAKPLLEALIADVLDPLSADDFFGTEGWEHCFGLED